MTKLETAAEQHAVGAQENDPFLDLNLLGVKTKVAEILSLIGSSQIFREYTLHDITHVDKMLHSLDWIIPDETRDNMTPADWLLITLAIYLHDVGMLVTDAEFGAREETDFRTFCERELFAGDVGTDYKSKVARLGDDQDRFLYQEYVRHSHAVRIGDWIKGGMVAARGVAPEIASAIASILSPLPEAFRADLALVCESHHLDDLYDTTKYPVSQPYGDSDDATANVQYAALVLRTADLLHITNDRTPSTMFHLIDPQDPVSQREWSQQQAVRRIRSQRGRDTEGNFTDSAPQDTIEVFATYSDPDAFFGLTSYLTYADKQLKLTREWVEASVARFGHTYGLPWKAIDTTNVRADGFSPKQLAFSLDQTKILDLLTGHTLYNDTSVVLRELAQNGLDAARLQMHIEERDSKSGLVEVEWDSEARQLVVRDNGTGMTAGVIERNLLRAGASRYQEEPFRKKYPEFSPISKFGIGVLSAFMIADSVEITTCSEEESEGHQLTLRSVHGRYLVRLLDKVSDPAAQRVGPHGTEIRLSVRESAELTDIRETIRKWIVVPRCSVRVSIDGDSPEEIGYDSPADALKSALLASNLSVYEGQGEPERTAIKVVEAESAGVRTAFAVEWSPFFREWSFLSAGRLSSSENASHALGTCIEGIRVESDSAGFQDIGVLSLADAQGHNAPKTNVARVGLEATSERVAMLRGIYGSYVRHVAEECEALHSTRGLSLTWAAQEGEVLLRTLLSDERVVGEEPIDAVDPGVLRDEMRRHPLMLVESGGQRELTRAETAMAEPELWTVDSGLVRAAEELLREIPSEGSLHSLASGFESDVFDLPSGMTLVAYQPSSELYQDVLSGREVAEIRIRRDQRRVDLGWMPVGEQPNWLGVRVGSMTGRGGPQAWNPEVYVALTEIETDGREGEVAVRAYSAYYLFSDSPLAMWLCEHAGGLRDEGDRRAELGYLGEVVQRFLSRNSPPEDLRNYVTKVVGSDPTMSRNSGRPDLDLVDLDGLVSALEETPIRTFDTWAWVR